MTPLERKLAKYLKPRKVWVVECPSCSKPVDFSGEGGIYFRTKGQAMENAPLWIGTAGESLSEICGCDNVVSKGNGA